ncbi:hypothetical protein [Polyangium sp. y55x31]|uniref:hypothetical protein n=1 Tax=Polyangium sp. y55x31 TaxID=3042688 RepID=UPI00248236D7|nr:hypothetical protein [Polyangium sp. y55x31]MDI1477635.1 hypothetical protein [Polyangium sp. y55x31]
MKSTQISGLLLAAMLASGCRAEPVPVAVTEPEAAAPGSGGKRAEPQSVITDDAGVPDAAAVASPCAASAGKTTVVEHERELFSCAPNAAPRKLTTGGKDWAPSLAADGKHVVFLRDAGTQRVRLGSGPNDFVDISDDRVMLLDLETGDLTEIGRNDEREGCLSLGPPQLVDAKTVIVAAHGYEVPTIHNLSVCLVDIPTRKLHLLGHRTRCALPITAGRHKGRFYVSHMDFKVGQGVYESNRLVDREGHIVKRLEDNPFIRDWNGDGHIMNEETYPECGDVPMPAAEVEAIMKKL